MILWMSGPRMVPDRMTPRISVRIRAHIGAFAHLASAQITSAITAMGRMAVAVTWMEDVCTGIRS